MKITHQRVALILYLKLKKLSHNGPDSSMRVQVGQDNVLDHGTKPEGVKTLVVISRRLRVLHHVANKDG
jgi:hypothetical protein